MTTSTAPRVTEQRIDRDDAGDWFIDTGATRITHYHGDTVEHADLFTIDAPDPLDPAGLAAHISACRALLDFIDPTRVNRLPAPTAAHRDRVELLAQTALADYGPDVVRAQVAAARSGVWAADPVQRQAWERALVLAEQEVA